MKRTIILTLLFSLAFLFTINGASAALSDDLYLYYTFDDVDTVGTDTVDSLGHNNLTIGVSVTTGVAGLLGEAYDLPGGNGLDKILSNPTGMTDYGTVVGQGGRTFSTWVKSDNLQVGTLEWLFGGGAGAAWFIIYTPSTEAFNVGYGSKNVGITASPGLQNNTWYNIVVVYNGGATEGTQLYVNGVQQGNVSHTAPPVIDFAADGAWFGGDGGGNNAFNGLIDEWGAWNRSLDQTEVTELYNGGTPLNPLVAPNTAPGVTTPSASPASPTEDEAITWSVTYTDPEGDSGTVRFEHSVNGTNVLNETVGATNGSIISSIIAQTYYEDNATVSVLATPNDGSLDGTGQSNSIITSIVPPTPPPQGITALVAILGSLLAGVGFIALVFLTLAGNMGMTDETVKKIVLSIFIIAGLVLLIAVV